MADNGAVGEVKISTKLDNSGVEKSWDQLSAKMQKEVTRLTAAFDRETLSIKRQESALESMRRKIDAIAQGDKQVASLTAMESQLKRITKEYAEQDRIYKDLSEQIRSTQLNLDIAKSTGDVQGIEIAQRQLVAFEEEAERLIGPLARLDEEMSRLKKNLETARMNPELSPEAKDLADKIGLAEEKLEQSKSKANQLKDALKNAYSQGADPTKKSFSESLKSLNKMVPKIKLFSLLTKAAGNNAKKTNSAFKQMTTRLKNLVVAAFVFNVIRRALTSLRNTLGEVLKANKQFAQSWNNIKVNLLTAFAPIWQVLQPKVISFMHTLESATQVIAKFVAALFGMTYQQAKDAAKAINDESKALDKSGKSADKASKKLARFDDINQLTADTAAEAAEETEGLDFGAGTEVDTSWFDKLLDVAKSAVDEFYGLGKALGEAINHGLRSIDWDSALSKAKSAAKKITSLLNGLVDGIDWDLLGYSVAQGINTALTFAYTLMTTFNWGNFGLAIANFLNSAIQNINWELLGKTLASGWVAAIDFLYNFVVTFNWEAFGQAIATSVNAWFTAIDWKKAAITISEGIKGLLNTLISFIKTVDWYLVGKSIGDFLANIDWKGILANVAVAVGAALGGIFSAIWASLGGNADDVGEAFKSLLGWLDRNKESLANILDVVLKVIAALVLIKTTIGIASGAISMLTGAFKLLSSPIGIIVAGIALLITLIYQISQNWEIMNWAEKMIAVFGALAVAAGILAIAIGAVKGPAGIALALAGIALGTVAVIASIKSAQSRVPALADGAVLYPNQPFAAIVGDQKHGTNIEAPMETIKQGVREVLAEGGQSQGAPQVVLNADPDMAALVRAIFPALKAEESRRGTSMSSTLAPNY